MFISCNLFYRFFSKSPVRSQLYAPQGYCAPAYNMQHVPSYRGQDVSAHRTRGTKHEWKNRVLENKVSPHSKLQVFSSGWSEAIFHLGQRLQLPTPLHYTKAPRIMCSSSIRSGAMLRSLSASHCTILEATTQQKTWMAESGGHCSITVRISSLSSSNIWCGVVHCIFHVFSPAVTNVITFHTSEQSVSLSSTLLNSYMPEFFQHLLDIEIPLVLPWIMPSSSWLLSNYTTFSRKSGNAH